MNELMIGDIGIRRDAEGRYCLNDLHRASGGNPNHRPGEWLRNKQTRELVAELGGAEIPAGPVVTLNDGQNNGTYVAKELVYAYAMWISAAFHLKVIRAYDAMVAQPQFAIPQTLPEALRLAADLAEQNKALESKVAEQTPKVQALDRIATAGGSLCVTDAAKALQAQPRRFFKWLSERHWIYRRPGGASWLGYQDKVQSGFLEHKVTEVSRSDGSEKVVEQVRVTPKGMVRLAQMLSSGGLTA
ncbi:hypothetical protein LMG10661_03776 [Ralstonia syzygii subsp. syzygii]|nr:hypothetical protein LMG10661_03776 [Ralstonia syzygii subsp. syzygii]